MKKIKGNIPIMLMLIIGGLAIVAVGTALWFNVKDGLKKDSDKVFYTNTTANQNTNANTNSASNANTTADETADWKTYTNTTFNFSFKYPNDWKIEDPKSTGDEVGVTLVSPQFSAGTTGLIGEVSVIVFKNLSGKSLSEYSTFVFSDVGTIGKDIPQPTTFTLNGYSAQRFDKFTTTMIAPIAPRTQVDIKGLNNIVSFILSNTNDNFDAHVVILDEIISTFQFTN